MRGCIGILIGAVIGFILASVVATFLAGAVLPDGQGGMTFPIIGVLLGGPGGLVVGALAGWLIGRRKRGVRRAF